MDEKTIGIYIACALGGIIVGYIIRNLKGKSNLASAERQAEVKLKEAAEEGERIKRNSLVEAKDTNFALREKQESEFDVTRKEIKNQEKRLTKREDALDRKMDSLDEKENNIVAQEQSLLDRKNNLQNKINDADDLLAERRAALEKIVGMTREEGREALLKQLEVEMAEEIDGIVRRNVERAKETANEKAREIVINVVERMAVEFTAEHTVSTVEIPSDEIKGRIIGREGRNIRAFESATGVDVIVDDTPGVVVVSAFDGVRREIGRLALSKLINDGRIHPARIEEEVTKVRKEMTNVIRSTGEQVVSELDIGAVKPKIIECLGRMRYRTSYGQNALQHSIEVSLLCGHLAAEFGLDEVLARRCGLLHDVGKAVDQELEGTHIQLGIDITRRCDEAPQVINSVASHHGDHEPESLYAVITAISDAISAARPGARRESLERYIKRLERLEAIATEQEGVDSAYAIQAGREIRVIADAEKLSDADCMRVCRSIATQIEEELTYPGEVRVTLMRETRVTEYAR